MKQYKTDDYIISLNTLYSHLLIFKIINFIINNSKKIKMKKKIHEFLEKIKELIF